MLARASVPAHLESIRLNLRPAGPIPYPAVRQRCFQAPGLPASRHIAIHHPVMATKMPAVIRVSATPITGPVLSATRGMPAASGKPSPGPATCGASGSSDDGPTTCEGTTDPADCARPAAPPVVVPGEGPTGRVPVKPDVASDVRAVPAIGAPDEPDPVEEVGSDNAPDGVPLVAPLSSGPVELPDV